MSLASNVDQSPLKLRKRILVSAVGKTIKDHRSRLLDRKKESSLLCAFYQFDAAHFELNDQLTALKAPHK